MGGESSMAIKSSVLVKNQAGEVSLLVPLTADPLCRICVLCSCPDMSHISCWPHVWLSTLASCAACRRAAASLWCRVC